MASDSNTSHKLPSQRPNSYFEIPTNAICALKMGDNSEQ
jgi:hypothetical protein